MRNGKQKKVDYSNKFLKQLKKAPLEIIVAFRDRLRLFRQDPFHPTLNNHKLTGRLKGFRSINITGDWRAIYMETDTAIIFELFGTHIQLYK
ncbi:MAG: type II toxin-antitoxin system mRNA interferase toxin, RelE/StbE family [Candidatus Levybacteria bacterium CG_4_10_14_0_2_um_filter_36_16]|nr:MAG: type II toxin-antitoxin system mRNA interferase toxin, RelE/StbE family [Candidatus Levybacteria bacterium CG_4_10_14_0_2_um_filter_36_16]